MPINNTNKALNFTGMPWDWWRYTLTHPSQELVKIIEAVPSQADIHLANAQLLMSIKHGSDLARVIEAHPGQAGRLLADARLLGLIQEGTPLARIIHAAPGQAGRLLADARLLGLINNDSDLAKIIQAAPDQAETLLAVARLLGLIKYSCKLIDIIEAAPNQLGRLLADARLLGLILYAGDLVDIIKVAPDQAGRLLVVERLLGLIQGGEDLVDIIKAAPDQAGRLLANQRLRSLITDSDGRLPPNYQQNDIIIALLKVDLLEKLKEPGSHCLPGLILGSSYQQLTGGNRPFDFDFLSAWKGTHQLDSVEQLLLACILSDMEQFFDASHPVIDGSDSDQFDYWLQRKDSACQYAKTAYGSDDPSVSEAARNCLLEIKCDLQNCIDHCQAKLMVDCVDCVDCVDQIQSLINLCDIDTRPECCRDFLAEDSIAVNSVPRLRLGLDLFKRSHCTDIVLRKEESTPVFKQSN